MRVRSALALGDAAALAKAYEGYVAERGDDDKDLLASSRPRRSVRRWHRRRAAQDARDRDGRRARAARARDQVSSVSTTRMIAWRRRRDRGFARLSAGAQVASDSAASENAEARRIAVDGIGKKVGKLALADLEEAADDNDARVRAVALRWLGELKTPTRSKSARSA